MLLGMISAVEDEGSLLQLKEDFEREKHLYHPEQARLISAQLFGRFQYLREEGRLSMGFTGVS